MSQAITITSEDILHQVKLSCKIPETIEAIVARKVMTNAVAEIGIKVETRELQQEADKFRLTNQLRSTDDTWKWLQNNGLSLEDFEEMVYASLISRKLAYHLFANQVESYFFEHQLDYTEVVMYEAILDDEDLALELFYGIQEGEMSFYDVAQQYIQDKQLRRSGGYRGIVHRQDLKPEISAAVFASKPPQLIKPIVTSQGIHLILVEEIIRPQLNNKLRLEIMSELFDQWLNQQMKRVEILSNFNLVRATT